jgi:hypothetical protein
VGVKKSEVSVIVTSWGYRPQIVIGHCRKSYFNFHGKNENGRNHTTLTTKTMEYFRNYHNTGVDSRISDSRINIKDYH